MALAVQDRCTREHGKIQGLNGSAKLGGLAHDTGEAVDFLAAVYPGEPRYLVEIGTDGKLGGDKFDPEDGERMRRWIEGRQDKKNLYFHANRLRRDPAKFKATKDDIGEAGALHVDIDAPKKPAFWSDPEAVEEWRGKTLARLKAHTPSPSVIVWTGGGFQALWLLEEPFQINGDEEKIAALEAYNKALEKEFAADPCHNVDRLLRLPGTINVLSKTKREAGRSPGEAYLVEFEPSRRYPISAFSRFTASDAKRAPKTSRKATPAGKVSVPGAATVLMLALPEPLQRRIRSSPAEGDRSTEACAAIRALLDHGLDPADVEAVLAAHPAGVAAKYIERGDLRAEIARHSEKMEKAKGADEDDAGYPYRETDRGIVWLKRSRDAEAEPIATPLTNFTARIVRDVIEDDGAEESHVVEVEAKLNGRARTFSVPSAAFMGMGWAMEKMGAEAYIAPGMGTKDHARAAIQKLSGRIPERRIYTHTGWREIAGRWAYLHNGGAIGAEGPVPDIGVSLSGVLTGYELPDPPRGEALRDAVRASLGILDIAPDRVTVPLLATVWRAPLGVSDFTTHLAGKTGAFKSAIAGLAMQHWGASWSGTRLPSNFESTVAFTQSLLFHAKDALLVVDDFIPPAGQYEAAKYDANAGRLIRGAGNIAGRGRADTTGKARVAKPPRGQMLTTGEDTPSGHSGRARQFIVEWVKEDVVVAKLTAAQEAGRAGSYAAAMAGYVQWLAAGYPARKAAFEADAKRMQGELHARYPHGRTASTAGALIASWETFLSFAEGAGAIDADEAARLSARAEKAICEVAGLQGEHQTAADPVARFPELLAAAISSGQAHVASLKGGRPATNPGTWGWRHEDGGTSWREQGLRAGWVDGDNLYLEPEASYKAATAMASGGGLGMSVKTLHKRMDEKGLILAHEKERCTTKISIEGGRKRVLHVATTLLLTPPSA